MRVHITGVAGVLGSYLAELFTKMGFLVQGNDIARIDEAWRLKGVRDSIRYIWKATQDLTQEDLAGVDLIIDAGLMVADRPMGTSSPEFTTLGNLLPPLRLLELVRRMPNNPFLIYPSSFNSLYGHPPGTTFTEDTLPNPSTVYGWTKGSSELLYLAYHKSFGVKAIITRIGSSYGERGRCYDEKTEILTNEGWKKFSELRGDELVYTLNPETMEIVLQPIKRIYVYDYDGEMYHIHNSFIDLIVTPNHKMFFAPYEGKPRREPIEEMLKYSYVRLFNTGRWKGERKEKICFTQKLKVCKVCGYVGKYFGSKEPRCSRCRSRRVEIVEKEICYPMDDFLKFLGFWIGDGGLGKRKSSEIIITQVKENTRREILELCRSLFKDSTITIKKNQKQIIIHNRWVYEWLEKNVGRNKMERRIPNEIKNLSPEQLRILLEWLMKADGTNYGTRFSIYTSNPKLRDDIMEIALKAGFSSRYYIRPKGLSSRLKEGRVIVQKYDNYQIFITKKVGNNPVLEIRKVLNKKHKYTGKKTFIEVVHYKGKVYDVELPENHLIYVRRNGKPIWSSNSDELPHRLIIYGLLGKPFKLRSPYASRLWSYIEDAGSFYVKLVEKIMDEPDAVVGKVLILAGNKGDRVVTNVELAELIRGFIPTLEYELGEYEPGELINGKPVHFTINSERTRKLLNWQPQYTLEEGLARTIEWFKQNLHYYV
jgi:nucleoside-diphosphate-sugar epimerase/intein/homing endonuclease